MGRLPLQVIRYHSFKIVLKLIVNLILSPEGKKLRSRNELKRYLEKTNSTYSYADLSFLFKCSDEKKPTKKNRIVQKPSHPAVGVWRRKIVQRKRGITAGQCDVYYYRYIIQYFTKLNTINLYILKVLKGKSSGQLSR